MPQLIKDRWLPRLESGLPRSARRGCDYEAYVPDPIAGREFFLAGETAADIADAEAAVHRLNAETSSLIDSEAVARLLLRAEAVASSKIEGLEVGSRRLLKAQLALGIGADPGDVSAAEILNNIEAMRWAVDTAAEQPELRPEHILKIHERLLRDTHLDRYAGKARQEQNWIGGSSHNPCSAAFIPPPPEYVPKLLEDICDFSSEDRLPALAQAAIAHAQFETIHPFVDGNGRVGRALIHTILKRRGVASRVVPPVSLVLATWSSDYIAALTATRCVGGPTDPAAVRGYNDWIALFANAVSRAVSDAETYEETVREIQGEWRRAVGKLRSDSAAHRLIAALPGAPVVTVQTAAGLIERSVQATNEAIARLVEAGVLKQTNLGKRNRAFEAPDLIDAFTSLERQLASPEADTGTSEPTRPVPYRPDT
jgi:Fic family protein